MRRRLLVWLRMMMWREIGDEAIVLRCGPAARRIGQVRTNQRGNLRIHGHIADVVVGMKRRGVGRWRGWRRAKDTSIAFLQASNVHGGVCTIIWIKRDDYFIANFRKWFQKYSTELFQKRKRREENKTFLNKLTKHHKQFQENSEKQFPNAKYALNTP